jgi:hypothetical protein
MYLLPSRKQADTVDFAIVAWHELLHCYGFAEADIPKTWTMANYKRWDGLAQELGATMPLQPAKGKAGPVERQAQRLRKAQAGLKRWQRKARLAGTKIKQYRKKVSYYERRASHGEAEGLGIVASSDGTREAVDSNGGQS